MSLKTNYKEDVFSGNRKYTITNNGDGTVSLTDVTEYSQVGDVFGADDINETNTAVNELTSYLELSQTLSTTDSTDFVFTDASIHSDSNIRVFAGRTNGDISGARNTFNYLSSYTTNGSCTITYPQYEAISLTVRIYIK